MQDKKIFSLQVETKSLKYEGKIIGYGAFYRNIDTDDDVILPNAFDKSIAEHKSGAKRIPLLDEHDDTRVWADNINIINDDGIGLKIEAEVNEARKPEFKKMFDKRGLSVGYIVEKSHKAKINGKNIRIITEANLLEISATEQPANLEAKFMERKSYKSEEFREAIKERFEGITNRNGLKAAAELLMKDYGRDISDGCLSNRQRSYIVETMFECIDNIPKEMQCKEMKSLQEKQNLASADANKLLDSNQEKKIIFDNNEFKKLIQ